MYYTENAIDTSEYFESLVDELFKAYKNRHIGDEDYIKSLEQDIKKLEKHIIWKKDLTNFKIYVIIHSY